MPEWTRVRLGDAINIKHGYAFKGEYFSDSEPGPLLVTPGNFATGGGFQLGKPKYYLGPIPDGFALEPGDLVVTMTDLSKGGDTLGYAAIIPDDGSLYLHNQRIGLVQISRPEVIDRSFLYYSLRTHSYRSHVLAGATGSTVRHTSPSRICDYTLRVPDLSTQRVVAAILGVLDNKIAVNERIVECCDELRSSALADFFRTQVGGTEDRPLSACAEFVNGRAFTKGATGTGRMVVRIAELNSGPGGSTVHNDIEVPERHLARPGDVLFAWSGSLTVARWYRHEAIINQHIFKVIPKDHIPTWLAYELVLSKLAAFKGIAADKATTMGHIQRHHLDEPVTAPAEDAIPALDAQLGSLWERALAAEQESLALVELRDTLLPGLMSGAIRVRDAEKAVADAT